MSQQSRALRRKLAQRKKLFAGLLALFILFAVFAGYYRSNQKMILQAGTYTDDVSATVYFLRDSDYLLIDDFSAAVLAVPEGSKISGYTPLTNTPVVINQDYLNTQIQVIGALLSAKYYEDWDRFSRDMLETITKPAMGNQSAYTQFENGARYCPEPAEALQKDQLMLQDLNTGAPTQITLEQYGLMKTGFVYSGVSEYDKLACEAALGAMSQDMLGALGKLSTSHTPALRVVNNDHCYAAAAVDARTEVQGEADVKALYEEYGKDLSLNAYYEMLITRVDRLREYPAISFSDGPKKYPAYLVNVIEDGNKKILVLMIKDYLQDLMSVSKKTYTLNVQNYKAWIVPQTAVIRRDGKTYLQLLEKGYFKEEVEVKVSRYDKGKAILSYEDNPDLRNGNTIKIYP